MEARLTPLLADEDYAATVAATDSDLVGLAGACTGRYFERNGLCTRLLILVTSGTSQSTGVGTALMNTVESWARDRGAHEPFVNSGNHRTAAHRFYQSSLVFRGLKHEVETLGADPELLAAFSTFEPSTTRLS